MYFLRLSSAYIIWTRHREEQAPPLPDLCNFFVGRWLAAAVNITQRNKKAPLCKGSSRVSGWGIVFYLRSLSYRLSLWQIAVRDINFLARFSLLRKRWKEKSYQKKFGQKHSRLGRERVSRFRYSLFFPISTSASSSAGRAEAQITVSEGLLAPPPPPPFEKGGRKLLMTFKQHKAWCWNLFHSSSFGSFLERKEQKKHITQTNYPSKKSNASIRQKPTSRA